MMPRVPHSVVVVLFCLMAVAGYGSCSVWVISHGGDTATVGDVVGTWKSFAVAAFAFWIGSSSGGKIRDLQAPVAGGDTADTSSPTTQETTT